ncbi:methyltransferase [Bacillus sp. Root239]|nr:methyltransferase [Bacillus sp. Root239]
MYTTSEICQQFGQILNAKSKVSPTGCSVSLKRSFQAHVQGRKSSSVVPVGVSFETIDAQGNALNLAEIAILQEEIPRFTEAAARQGLIVSALHNHWLFTEPVLMYLHIQSVEPPLHFAKKMAFCFTTLKSLPVPTNE